MDSQEARKAVVDARRIVVKIGSSSLTKNGTIRDEIFTDLARQISALKAQGREVVLVSSGAVAAGSRALGWESAGDSIREKQAAAAVGQIHLMESYRREFEIFDTHVAQVLVTRTGLDNRERFLNARHTLLHLLELGVVPVVNENDAVSPEEIRFGDNDNLSATVLNLVSGDLLIILTDVDGLYVEKPQDGQAKPALIEVVDEIDERVEAACGGSISTFGSGGMITKLEAARSARHSGAATVLCNSREVDVLLRVACKGENLGTLFLAGPKIKSRKHWLAFTTHTRGTLTLDDGAVQALQQKGTSLLPAGISAVDGKFGMGDTVSCVDTQGHEIARGLIGYDAAATRLLMGASTSDIGKRLGYSTGDEIIHRDDMVLTRDLNTQSESTKHK